MASSGALVGPGTGQHHRAVQQVRSPLGLQIDVGWQDTVRILIRFLDRKQQRTAAQCHMTARGLDLVDAFDPLHVHGQHQVDPVSGLPGPTNDGIAVFDGWRDGLAVDRHRVNTVGLGSAVGELADTAVGRADLDGELGGVRGAERDGDLAAPRVIRLLYDLDVRAGHVLDLTVLPTNRLTYRLSSLLGVHPGGKHQQCARDVADAARAAVPRMRRLRSSSGFW